jgi:hypothetical protein
MAATEAISTARKARIPMDGFMSYLPFTSSAEGYGKGRAVRDDPQDVDFLDQF